MDGDVGHPFAAVVDATTVAQGSEILITGSQHGLIFDAGDM